MSSAAPVTQDFSLLERIRPLMRRKGVTLEPHEFHRQVNIIFHAWESHTYDQLHKDMAQTLPRIWNSLVQDLLAKRPLFTPRRVLDIGCGTGQSMEMLLKTPLGAKIERIHLLDTSAKMLDYCRTRPCLKGKNVTFIEGAVEDLPASDRYDLIITSSVLHHLVDLAGFCRKVNSLQERGGVFLHIQDPNGDALTAPGLHDRMARLDGSLERRAAKLAHRYSPVRAAKALGRRLTGNRVTDYLDHVNAELLAKNIVSAPLSAPEIWSITDIRVMDDLGISLRELQACLPGYEPASQRSYSFFGDLAANLPRRFRAEENRLSLNRSMEGMHLAAMWSKQPDRATSSRS